MSRAGRKRKHARREENGREARENRTEAREVVREVGVTQRVQHYGVPKAQASSPFAGFALGRCFLRGEIDAEQRLSGELWASLDARYRAVYGLKAPQPPAVPFVPQRGVSLADEPQEPEKLIARYREAEHVLQAVHGRLRAVEATCLYDEEPYRLSLLISGLDSLVRIWGLTTRRIPA